MENNLKIDISILELNEQMKIDYVIQISQKAYFNADTLKCIPQ